MDMTGKRTDLRLVLDTKDLELGLLPLAAPVLDVTGVVHLLLLITLLCLWRVLQRDVSKELLETLLREEGRVCDFEIPRLDSKGGVIVQNLVCEAGC